MIKYGRRTGTSRDLARNPSTLPNRSSQAMPGVLEQYKPHLAALALHTATLYLRSQNPDDPIIWAAHIHSGA